MDEKQPESEPTQTEKQDVQPRRGKRKVRAADIAGQVGRSLGQGVDMTVDAVTDVGRFATGAVQHSVASLLRGRPLDLPLGLSQHRKPGMAAGLSAEDLEALPATDQPVSIEVFDYNVETCERVQYDNAAELLKHLEKPRGEGDERPIRWININGLTDPLVLAHVARTYRIHPLALEDVVHVGQRPKLEMFPVPEGDDNAARMYMVIKQIHRDAHGLDPEQLSLFLGSRIVITIQQHEGDVFGSVRERIERESSKLRHADASFLIYALLDAVVDGYFPLLDTFATRLEEIETQVIEKLDQAVMTNVRHLRQELLLLRREIWPMRELLHQLQRDEEGCLSDQTQMYLRDVYDHAVQVIDLIESYREYASGLNDAYLNAVSHRMNEVMKVITIIGALFLPISFLAGVFGMNFDRIPGLHHPAAFAFFCLACVGIVVGMLVWFRRKGWL